MLRLFLLLQFMLFSYTLTVKAVDRCRQISLEIRKAHFYYFGLDFPYWYSIAQAEKESRCRHSVLSTDGIGSEGFAQITYRWWKDKLEKEGITEIKSMPNHARAQAFINKYEYDRTRCKKLFEMYQRYNGGALVSRELALAGSCRWGDGRKVCKRKTVCVWLTSQGCKQYRDACDINYEYSLRIYEAGQKYRVGSDSLAYQYW